MSRFLLVDEVAEKLRLHPNTVRGYIKKGILPAARFGKVYRVKEKDVEEFIERATRSKK